MYATRNMKGNTVRKIEITVRFSLEYKIMFQEV